MYAALGYMHLLQTIVIQLARFVKYAYTVAGIISIIGFHPVQVVFADNGTL